MQTDELGHPPLRVLLGNLLLERLHGVLDLRLSGVLLLLGKLGKLPVSQGQQKKKFISRHSTITSDRGRAKFLSPTQLTWHAHGAFCRAAYLALPLFLISLQELIQAQRFVLAAVSQLGG